MGKSLEELLVEYENNPSERVRAKIERTLDNMGPAESSRHTRRGKTMSDLREEASKLFHTTDAEQRKQASRDLSDKLRKEDREKTTLGRRLDLKADFRGVPFFFGHRNQTGWATGFRTAWLNQHANPGLPAKWTCLLAGKTSAHANCVGTSANMGDFEIDHIKSLWPYIDSKANALLYCDGTHHWKVYLLGNRDDIAHPVRSFMWWLGDDGNVYKHQGNHQAPPGVKLEQPVPTILELAHWDNNLQVLCQPCNGSKNGTENLAGYRPELVEVKCSCGDGKAKYLGFC